MSAARQDYMETLHRAKDAILGHLPESLQKPRVLIICGSGLGGIAKKIKQDDLVEIPYSQIPGFKVSTGK